MPLASHSDARIGEFCKKPEEVPLSQREFQTLLVEEEQLGQKRVPQVCPRIFVLPVEAINVLVKLKGRNAGQRDELSEHHTGTAFACTKCGPSPEWAGRRRCGATRLEHCSMNDPSQLDAGSSYIFVSHESALSPDP